MAIIYRTTMQPGKLELLAAWLPAQPWYRGAGSAPVLARAGGFRLDDPEGEVGIEIMVVTDGSGERPVSYLTPLTYRGAPLDGAEAGLIGTSEHGVLGTRWIYDATHDPVAVAQLLALLQGRAVAQDQALSDAPDRSVGAWFQGPQLPVLLPQERPEVSHTVRGTDVRLPGTAAGEGRPTLTVTRLLRPQEADGAEPTVTPGVLGGITGDWTPPDGAAHRGLFASLRAHSDGTA